MTADGTKRQTPIESNPATPQEKELAEVCARFADLCQYFRQQEMELPSQIVEEVRHVSKLAVNDRITRIKHLNRGLMEYLDAAGRHHQVRQ
ncbi:MAG TPA: hypothetical protein VGS27_31155 [Candidatus Sulfotelmatobacter sp.]|nr:hypothetical protein [Candidatus Sulfotelmatobacter sp.]